ncbi:MAG: hypothetical protein GY703_00135 [Gammaproteobacteria bacterium]|nr:hypothetical protein [Gammaproteobacteria bacterium]
MKQDTQTNIYYDAEYFDVAALSELDAIDLLDQEEKPKLLSSSMAAASEQESADWSCKALTEEDQKLLIESAWQELQESEFGAELADLSDEETAEIKWKMLNPDPVAPDSDVLLESFIKTEYQINETDNFFSHKINGHEFLRVPLTAGRGKAAVDSKKLAFLIAAAQVVVDIVAILIAASGVRMARLQKAAGKATTTLASSAARSIAKNARAMRGIGGAISKTAKLQAALKFAKQVFGLPKVVGLLISSMSKLEKIGVVASVVAAAAAAAASGSASVWIAVLSLTTAVAAFLIDAGIAVEKYQAWGG